MYEFFIKKISFFLLFGKCLKLNKNFCTFNIHGIHTFLNFPTNLNYQEKKKSDALCLCGKFNKLSVKTGI